MIKYTEGNLLDADADALVNTVNTVGVMGKGIALMFKERFAKNTKIYTQACKASDVHTGKMLVTDTEELMGPKWIINFPTKQHWRNPSKLEWVIEGLADLRSVIIEKQIKSIAIPPLGAGNGGLDWLQVRQEIENALGNLSDVDIYVFEPTSKYQNVAKRTGVQKLTPARALVAELVRRYWILGIECSLLEVQKLAWFLERVIEIQTVQNPLQLKFKAERYGPYADRLRHLLDGLDGSYLKSDKRIADSSPLDVIWFDDSKTSIVSAYLQSEAKDYLPALEQTSLIIDGFESPFGLELLATVDWLIHNENAEPTVDGIITGLKRWSAGEEWAQRKARLFDERVVAIALARLQTINALYV